MAESTIKKPSLKADLFALSGGIVKKAAVDAKQAAQKIIEEAKTEAFAIRQQALKSATEMRENAYKLGHETGLAEFTERLLQLNELKNNALKEVEVDIVRLSIKIAEKIVGHEIEKNDETLIDIINTAIRNVRQSQTLTIRVNPIDMLAIDYHRDKVDANRRAQLVDFVADPQIASGGCLIESEAGKVDAQLETQLRVLERCLLDKPEPQS